MLSRKKLKIDSVVRVKRYRGEPDCFAGKVVAIRDCYAKPLERETERDRKLSRSRYLVTLEAIDKAERRFRSFYSRFIEE